MTARVDAIVSDFLRTLGTDGESAGAREGFCIEFESGARFFLEQGAGVAVVGLVRSCPEARLRAMTWSLMRCHRRYRDRWPLHVGLLGERELLFAQRLPLAELEVPKLFDALKVLSGVHDQLREGVGP